MVSGATARDSFIRAMHGVIDANDVEYLMDRLSVEPVTELATKTDVRVLGAELRAEMAELRAEMRTELAEIRSVMTGFITKKDLNELLALHVDARAGKTGRWWLFATMGMQAATIAGVIAAVRL